VQRREDLANVLRERDEHLGAVPRGVSARAGAARLAASVHTHLLPAIVIRPTMFSGFEFVLASKRMLTASACASQRDGV
jgi:hypothetical protein